MPKTRKSKKQTKQTKRSRKQRGASRRFYPTRQNEVISFQDILERMGQTNDQGKIELIPEMCSALLMSREILKSDTLYNVAKVKLNEFKRNRHVPQQTKEMIDVTLVHIEEAHSGALNQLPYSQY